MLIKKAKNSRILFHGTRKRSLNILTPFPGDQRDSKTGHVVFATPFFDYACCFMALSGGKGFYIAQRGLFSPRVFVCADETGFRSNDIGGAVYYVSAQGFSYNKDKGGGIAEWVNPKPVEVAEKTLFPSVLDAMIENYVQVFFVDKDKMTKIMELRSKGLKLLDSLRSENQKQQKNILPLVVTDKIDERMLNARFRSLASDRTSVDKDTHLTSCNSVTFSSGT